MKTIRNITLAALTVLSLAPSVASAAAALNRVPGGGPSNTPTYSSPNEQACEYGMGYLGRVSVKQINAIDDDWHVWVRPVCENSPNAPVRNMGNATQLIGAIGRNEVLNEALRDDRFHADDVVGVKLTKGNYVMLWVHPSLY